MEKIHKRKRSIPVAAALGLDANDPEDRAWVQFRDLLVGLLKVMVKKGITKNELARRMHISRQAVYEKFLGKNTSMQWIQKACKAIGVEIRIVYVDRKRAA